MTTTVIIRHRKENLTKCSLRGLEMRADFLFLKYPLKTIPALENPMLLTFDAPLLTHVDHLANLIIVDGTWKYADKMLSNITWPNNLQKRSLPACVRTAYPRNQNGCPFPTRGLASIEALFVALTLLGRDTQGLFDHYYWKNQFLEINPSYAA